MQKYYNHKMCYMSTRFQSDRKCYITGECIIDTLLLHNRLSTFLIINMLTEEEGTYSMAWLRHCKSNYLSSVPPALVLVPSLLVFVLSALLVTAASSPSSPLNHPITPSMSYVSAILVLFHQVSAILMSVRTQYLCCFYISAIVQAK